MKHVLLPSTLLACLILAPLARADEEKACGCMQKKTEVAAKPNGDIDQLLQEVNTSTGERKLAAMAALLNKLAHEKATPPHDSDSSAESDASGGHHH